MATKVRKKIQKKKQNSTKRYALPIIAVVVLVGAIAVFKSMAGTEPYTRLQCYGADHRGYKDVPECYVHSKEGITARSFIAVLNRAPETAGLQYWADDYNTYASSATAQQQLIAKLLASSEAKGKITGLATAGERVTYLYNSVLKRKPDAGGAVYWEAHMKLDNNLAQTITSFLSFSEAYTKTNASVVSAIDTIPGTWYPTKVAKTVLPRGTYSNWEWKPPVGGYTKLEHDLTIDSYQPGSNFFWSHQFKMVGGDGGYIGLQSTGFKNPNGSYQKRAVFSMFNAAVAAAPTSCKIEKGTFDGSAGSGTSCIISFDWIQGRSYHLRTAKTGQDASGSWWSGWVIDSTTGQQTLIGSIKTPPAWKGFSDWSVMWTENFVSAATTCDDIPYSKVRFSKPLANGTIRPTGSSQLLSKSYQCNNSRISPTSANVTQEMGF